MKQAAHIVSGSSRLSQLTRRAEFLTQLQQLVLLELSPALREQVQIGDYQQGILTLLVRDSAWLTRLRYQQAALLNTLRKHHEFQALQNLRFKISLPQQGYAPPRKASLEISQRAKEHILQLAESTEDTELSQALKRLTRD